MILLSYPGSKKSRGTGIHSAIAPRDAEVDLSGQIELGHKSPDFVLNVLCDYSVLFF